MSIPQRYLQSIIAPGIPLSEAMARLGALKNVPLILFVTSDEGRLLGTITDGDIRRGLLRGERLDSKAESVMQRNYTSLSPGCDTGVVMQKAIDLHLTLLPKTDEQGILIDIVEPTLRLPSLPIEAVLMAGGRGERLRPLTLSKPKPLLPVGDQAIIDYNIQALENCGVERIYVTVNYLHEQIEAHFAGKENVECILEPAPLGTFGSIGLIPSLQTGDILVMNSDLLTDIDLRAFFRTHKESGADMTIACIPYTVSVPYAIMDIEQGRVKALQEKPTYNYLANAGVYLVKRQALSSLTGQERVDATDFIDSLLADPARKVGTFTIEGTWIDIGSPSDYEAACRRMNERRRI